ncbi:Frt2 protein [Maudiozyma humilis]|uniref:Frt2 protein n=1 Tax=Maudiozyma humilis TaxID=51915 RepID=A0AAV5RZG2_MAUHU|nr:Frt2 protein [Kazachstania humilis]
MSRLVDRMENGGSSDIDTLKRSFMRPMANSSGSRRNIALPKIEVNGVMNNNRRNSSSTLPTSPLSPLSPPGDRERRHAHHRKYREGNPDYTSATTGKFTDCMFNLGGEAEREETPDSIANGAATGNGEGDNDENTPENDKEAIDISEISLGNYLFRNHHPGAISSGAAETRLKTPVAKKIHRHKTSHDDDPRSASFNNDKKRLVNEFLESMAPPTNSTTHISNMFFPPPNASNSALNVPNRQNFKNITADDKSDSQRSLQSLLYHDLEGSPGYPEDKDRENTEYYNRMDDGSPTSNMQASLSRDSLATTETADSDSTSSSSFTTVSSLQTAGYRGDANFVNDSNVMLDVNDHDYYQHHIAAVLDNAENTMKINLRERALKREADFQKNLKDFDTVHTELETLKSRVVRLRDVVSDKYLIELNRDFDVSDSQSYQSRLNLAVNSSVAQLENIERRMEACKDRLDQQKEVVKRMDSLMFVENSLISSREKMSMMSKYRYVIFDCITVIAVGILAVLVKKHISAPEAFSTIRDGINDTIKGTHIFP